MNQNQETPDIKDCYVRISDLKGAILKNPYDPTKGDVSAYLRYIKYNTPFVEAEPVVRCKDCIWRLGTDCTRFAEVPVTNGDYCSRGERKRKR